MLLVGDLVLVFIDTGNKVLTPIIELTFFLSSTLEHAVPSFFVALEHAQKVLPLHEVGLRATFDAP